MKNIIGIIPARMASSRFPGKPLAKICGIPMVGHVYLRSKMSQTMSEVYVATCDEEIKKYIDSIGGKAVMTASTHKTCSDRVAEACKIIKTDADIVVNIQGDEPLIYPEMIDQSVMPFFKDPGLHCVNIISRIDSDKEFISPNTIKVVKDKDDFALYFSREPIPSPKKCSERYDRYKQVCILSFRREMLFKFGSMKAAPLEIVESIDMLRLLEHGYKIKLVEAKYKTVAVDNEEDRKAAEAIMGSDKLFIKYKPGR